MEVLFIGIGALIGAVLFGGVVGGGFLLARAALGLSLGGGGSIEWPVIVVAAAVSGAIGGAVGAVVGFLITLIVKAFT